MPKYAVLVNGRNVWTRMLQPRFQARLYWGPILWLLEPWFWKLLYRQRIEPSSFFTTRRVDAASPEAAARKAEALTVDEVRVLCANPPEQPFWIGTYDIREDPSMPQEKMPGAGFTWYEQDNEDAEETALEIEWTANFSDAADPGRQRD